MALADIESELTAGVPARMCVVCHYLSERDDEWGARLRRMLANRGIQFKALAKRLAADPDEPDIPWESLSRHARAGCSARESLR
jgi:hypothetical protein